MAIPLEKGIWKKVNKQLDFFQLFFCFLVRLCAIIGEEGYHTDHKLCNNNDNIIWYEDRPMTFDAQMTISYVCGSVPQTIAVLDNQQTKFRAVNLGKSSQVELGERMRREWLVDSAANLHSLQWMINRWFCCSAHAIPWMHLRCFCWQHGSI